MASNTLFCNTGMQIIYTGLALQDCSKSPWRPCEGVPWINYRITERLELVLCVDTNTGESSDLHHSESEEALRPFPVKLSFEQFGLDESIEISIKASLDSAGLEKPVTFVLDFGNCRSLGLLVEDKTPGEQRLPARPFKLLPHRTRWEHPNTQDEETFSSSFVLVSDSVPRVQVLKVREVPPVFGAAPRSWIDHLLVRFPERLVKPGETVEETVESDLFPDISPARLGKESLAFQGGQVYLKAGSPLVGMSSPKRYLWAKEMESLFWHQYVAEDNRFEPVRGRYYEFQPEDDLDWDNLPVSGNRKALAQPPSPRYPRRAMMTACMYELLSQAYQQINSVEYLRDASDPLRKRVLSNVVMTYPSGMSSQELGRYRAQVEKALKIFAHIHKVAPSAVPRLQMRLDEGTAGQLAYVYGEIQGFRDTESWLKHVGRKTETGRHSVRVASIDIGGGTSDVVISDYEDLVDGQATHLRCQIRHIDGASRAGDDIAEAVITRILIPQFANSCGLSRVAIRRYFEDSDASQRNDRKEFMQKIWMPLVHKYLEFAKKGMEDDFVMHESASSKEVVSKFEEKFREKLKDVAIINIPGTRFRYREDEFRRVLVDLFRPMLAGFCDAICRHDCDIVTLAGKPTELKVLSALIRDMLPLPAERFVPLGGYETGAWYPLPDPNHPGVIADPKSVVAVGAAIEYLCSGAGGLGNLFVEVVSNLDAPLSYYWGLITASSRTFSNTDALFKPGDASTGKIVQVPIAGREIMLGRRLNGRDESEPTPAFCLRVKCDQSVGVLTAKLRCVRSDDNVDEYLELVSVEGSVGIRGADGIVNAVPAEIGRHVMLEPKGILHSEYFLDSGVLYDIAYDNILLAN